MAARAVAPVSHPAVLVSRPVAPVSLPAAFRVVPPGTAAMAALPLEPVSPELVSLEAVLLRRLLRPAALPVVPRELGSQVATPMEARPVRAFPAEVLPEECPVPAFLAEVLPEARLAQVFPREALLEECLFLVFPGEVLPQERRGQVFPGAALSEARPVQALLRAHRAWASLESGFLRALLLEPLLPAAVSPEGVLPRASVTGVREACPVAISGSG